MSEFLSSATGLGLFAIGTTISAAVLAVFFYERADVEKRLREWRKRRDQRRWWSEYYHWSNRRGR